MAQAGPRGTHPDAASGQAKVPGKTGRGLRFSNGECRNILAVGRSLCGDRPGDDCLPESMAARAHKTHDNTIAIWTSGPTAPDPRDASHCPNTRISGHVAAQTLAVSRLEFSDQGLCLL